MQQAAFILPTKINEITLQKLSKVVLTIHLLAGPLSINLLNEYIAYPIINSTILESSRNS